MMSGGKSIAGVALLVLGVGGSSRALDYEVRGYAKDYPATWVQAAPSSDTVGVATRRWLNSTRGRLKCRWFATPQLTFAADYEARLAVTNQSDTSADRSSGGSDAGVVDMTWVAFERDRARLVHTIDRLYAQWYSPHVVATVGRQRIAWGVSDFFSPLDKFAPFAPAEIDKEEKVGVDAVAISVPWGSLSNLEAVYSIGRTGGVEVPGTGLTVAKQANHRAGLRFRTNVRDWDLSVVTGRFDGSNVIGGSFSGYADEAGVKGELLYSNNGRERARVIAPSPGGFAMVLPESLAVDRGDFVQITIGATYGFAWHNLTLSGELHSDGSGSSAESGYDWVGLALGKRLTLARSYAAGTVSLQPTPLTTVSLTLLANLDEPTALVQPQVEWSVRENLDLRVGIQANGGGADSEFGGADNLVYAVVAWYF